MRKLEITLFSTALLINCLHLIDVIYSAIPSLISLLLLSTFYFYLTNAVLHNLPLNAIFKKSSYVSTKKLRLTLAYVAGLAFSISIIASLFNLESFQGTTMLVYVGLVGSLLVLTLSVFKIKNDDTEFYIPLIKRSLIFTVLGLINLFI